jgi:hypothetical protein
MTLGLNRHHFQLRILRNPSLSMQCVQVQRILSVVFSADARAISTPRRSNEIYGVIEKNW